MNIKIILIFIITFIIAGCLDRSATDLKFTKSNIIFRGNQIIRGEALLNYASLKKYILKPKCISCHSGVDAKPVNDPIDFSSYESAMADRFIPLLIKGKPEISRLYKSVHSGKMPEEGTLHTKEIEYIKRWIKACAPKNNQVSIPDKCQSDDDDDDDDDWNNEDDSFESDEF